MARRSDLMRSDIEREFTKTMTTLKELWDEIGFSDDQVGYCLISSCKCSINKNCFFLVYDFCIKTFLYYLSVIFKSCTILTKSSNFLRLLKRNF